MTMYREPVRTGAFLVTDSDTRSYAKRAYVEADVALPVGTVLTKPDANNVYGRFTSAVGEEVGGLLFEAVDASDAKVGTTLRRTVLKADAEVTDLNGRITYPAGADAAETATLRAECIAGLAALGIDVVR